MKYTVILIFALIIPLNNAYCQLEESSLYSQVIDDFIEDDCKLKKNQSNEKVLIIFERPKNMSKVNNDFFTRFKKKYKKLGKSTFDNFLIASEQVLKTEYFSNTNQNIILLDSQYSTDRGVLIEKYPNWNLIIYEFSNIGFNEEMTQAILYYGYNAGAASAGGVYLIYEKKRGKWKKRKLIPAWAS